MAFNKYLLSTICITDDLQCWAQVVYADKEVFFFLFFCYSCYLWCLIKFFFLFLFVLVDVNFVKQYVNKLCKLIDLSVVVFLFVFFLLISLSLPLWWLMKFNVKYVQWALESRKKNSFVLYFRPKGEYLLQIKLN